MLYDFYVTATNDAGTSLPSTVFQALAADSPSVIEAPIKIFADQTQIKIGWSAPTDTGYSDIVGYKVFWNGGGTGALLTTPLYDTASPSIFTYTLVPPALVSGMQYSFAVAVYNSVTSSAPSNIVQIIAATVPAQPTPVVRTSSALTAITIAWVAPDNGGSPISSYKVLSNLGSGTALTLIGTTGGSTLSF